jgi:hypothetical protein
MSSVVGIDLSSRALDLVELPEDSNRAVHYRVNLEQDRRSSSWERTLLLPSLMPPGSWWDMVYLVAIEAPYGAGTGTIAILNRIVGAVAASLPAALQRPERCWVVRPDEWKRELGIAGKPTDRDLERLGLAMASPEPTTQDARDAACLAYFARETNARAISAA